MIKGQGLMSVSLVSAWRGSRRETSRRVGLAAIAGRPGSLLGPWRFERRGKDEN
jgi:hypothetical protein